MKKGWIKLHRKLLDSSIANKPNYLAVWITLLLRANHVDKKIIWNGKEIIISEGQILTGRKSLSKKTGVSETTLERILDTFERIGKIGQQKTNKFRVITIRKWNIYQEADNKRTTSGQQADTNKNDKNDKKKTMSAKAEEHFTKDQFNKLVDNYLNSNKKAIQIIATYWRFLNIYLDNRQQVNTSISRHARAAKALEGYTLEEIKDTMEFCDKDSNQDKNYQWTLETVGKKIERLRAN